MAVVLWLVSPDGLVEGGTEELAAVFTEGHTRDSFTVGAFEPAQTLAALDLPYLHTHTQSTWSVTAAGSQWLMEELPERTSSGHFETEFIRFGEFSCNKKTSTSCRDVVVSRHLSNLVC